MFGNPAQLIRSYQLYQVVIEMAVIWVCVYAVFRFLRGMRGAGMLKGLIVFFVLITLLIRVLGQDADVFGRLNYLYTHFLELAAIVLIVIFQPELRQAMIRISHSRHFRTGGSMPGVIGAVSEAATFLAKNQFGALIAIERNVTLDSLVEHGQSIDAEVSANLLETIFWPSSPLHDLGVVIRGNRIVAAGVQFPLAEEGSFPARTGSRHRAAAGLTVESDCIVVIVSEESGAISIAENGQIQYDVPREQVARELARRLEVELEHPSQTAAAITSDSSATRAVRPQSGPDQPTPAAASKAKAAAHQDAA
jgi:diadenylate cyclase